ncbi:hypothetical protein [Streptomyces vietnamensis]|uniref:hypothetical protein n=1 Tax=Streptomyces vietnamensis TaxID=362257 RepID=UPI00341DEDF6
MAQSTVAGAGGEKLLATHPRVMGRGVPVVEEAQLTGTVCPPARDAAPPLAMSCPGLRIKTVEPEKQVA